MLIIILVTALILININFPKFAFENGYTQITNQKKFTNLKFEYSKPKIKKKNQWGLITYNKVIIPMGIYTSYQARNKILLFSLRILYRVIKTNVNIFFLFWFFT